MRPGQNRASRFMEIPQPPEERGRIIYRWTPPALANNVLDVGGTPGEYVVFDLPRVSRRPSGWVDYGGCIIYGYLPQQRRWEANVGPRSLVRHLIDENRRLRELLNRMGANPLDDRPFDPEEFPESTKATPDLLAVLKEADTLLSDAYEYMDMEGADNNGPTMRGIQDIGEKIRAAIAKAEGR